MQLREPNSPDGLQLTPVWVPSGLLGIQKSGVSIITSSVKENTSKVAGSPVVARDVTSDKQGEAVSRLSEKQVLIALKHAPVVDAGSFGAWDNRRLPGSTDAEVLGEEQGALVTAICRPRRSTPAATRFFSKQDPKAMVRHHTTTRGMKRST